MSIKKIMKDNGCLVASIPNVRYWVNLFRLLIEKDWKYREAGILDKTHLRFFTEKSIKRTLEKHDFVLEKFQGINRSRSWIPITILLMTMGYYKDILFVQYGLRARNKNPFNNNCKQGTSLSSIQP